MADTDPSLYSLRYNQAASTLEAFGGGTPQWTEVTLNNVDPQQVPVTRLINTTAPLTGGGNLTADRTLSIPQGTSLANGYLLAADWTTFNNKLTSVLTSANIFVGNGSNIATERPVTGDVTLSNTGVVTLVTVNSNVGSFTNANITVDAKGRITAAASGADTGITQLTGDIIAGPGNGTQTATLATVNGNVGTFTNTTLTVNGKGLITAASSGATASGVVNPGVATHLAYYATSTSAVSDADGATISGNYTLSGATVFNTGITVTPTTNQLVLGATRTVTINAIQPAGASRTYSIPDQGSNANIVATQSDYSINGTWDFTTASGTTFSATSNQLILGTTRTTTISASQPASASRSINIPDPGTNSKFILQDIQGSAQQQISTPLILNGSITFNPSTLGIVGTTTNDNAAAGYIGEYISSTVGTTAFPTSGQYGDLTSISLTAGDWDVSCNQLTLRNGSTITDVEIGISTTSGNSGTGLVAGDNRADWAVTVGVATQSQLSLAIPVYRISLASTTTIYLKYLSDYAVATPNAVGRLSARRVR